MMSSRTGTLNLLSLKQGHFLFVALFLYKVLMVIQRWLYIHTLIVIEMRFNALCALNSMDILQRKTLPALMHSNYLIELWT